RRSARQRTAQPRPGRPRRAQALFYLRPCVQITYGSLVPMSGKSLAHLRGPRKTGGRRGFTAVYIYQGRPEFQAAPACFTLVPGAMLPSLDRQFFGIRVVVVVALDDGRNLQLVAELAELFVFPLRVR